MINLIKFRRSGLWLLSFIAALLVLSPSAGAYYVRGWFPKTGDSSFANYWGDGQDMGTDNKYTFGTIENDEDIYFKLSTVNKGNEGTHYGFTKDNIFELQTNYGNPPTSNGSLDDVGQFKISAKKGKCYEISFNNNDLVLTVTDDNGGGGGETTTSNVKFKYVITEGTDNSVDMADESSQKDGTYYTCTITPDKTADDYWIAVNYNGTWVSGQNDNQTLSFNSNNQAGEDNCGSYADDLKRFKIHLDAGQPYKIEFWPDYDGKKRIHITKEVGLPVFPIGIYNRKQLETYNEPTYYLLGELLNYNRVTPEYQFTKVETDADAARLQKLVADGETAQIKKGQYILEFTARNTVGRWTKGANEWKNNCYMSVVGYETPKSAQKTLYEKKSWEELGWYSSDTHNVSGTNGDFLEGMAAIAVFDPTDNTANKLQIVKKKTGKLPFISLVGAEWKQNTVANDDKAYETPGGHSYPNNTDAGWQEAWIQYNDNNEIAKDLNGNVMYNTMWPPRNPIKFKTAFTLNGKEYDFTVSSDALVLNPVVDETTGDLIIQTGENWKNDDRFKDVQSGEVAKANLFTADGDLNKGAMTEEEDRKENEFFEKLALDNNTNYRLYKVENVWINGKFKFWTGWTGGVANNDGANWNNNANWGHYKQQPTKDDNNNPIPPQKISPKSTIPLGNVDGDMVFDEPTYFKTLYFFYDVNSGKETNHSVFFTEIAKGGAEIAALSRENYTYGMYRPRLTDKNGILGASITGVKITSYKDEDNSKMFVVFNETYEDKTVNDWESLFTYNENGGWVYDTSKYPNGNYIYVMEVSIKDVNGVTDKIVVESNPFTVFRGDASASIRGYQLVKRQYPGQLPGQDGLGDEKYNYVTYTDDADDSTYLLKLEIKEDGKYGVLDPNKTYSLVDLLDMDSNAYIATEGDAKIPVVEDITGTKIDFTDGSLFRFSSKILLVGDIVGSNVLSVELLDKDDDPDTNPLEGDRIDNDNDYVLAREDTRYLSVVEPDIEKNGFHYNFTWKPNYNYTFEVADGSIREKTGQTEASLSDYLVLPEPKLISEESQIEMFYGDSPDNKNNDNVIEGITFSIADNMSTYEDEDGLAEVTLGADDNSGGARFQQLRTAIVIERPNVTRRFMALAADYINNSDLTQDIRPTLHYYDEDDDYKNSSPLIEAIYDFKLGGEQITLTNGRVYNDNGNNPDWFVYYTPARKPSYLYFDVSSLGNDEISGDPSKNIGAGVGDNNYFQTKYMTHTVRSTYKHVNFLNRWEDGKVHGIRIQQNAPHNSIETTFNDACENGRSKESSAVRIVSSTLAYDSAGDLIERVTIRINYKSDTENKLYRVDDSGEAFDPYDDSYEGKPLQYSDNSSSDYFYIRLVNKADEDLLPAQTVSAANLADGYELTFERNHGHFWDDQIETVVNDKDNRLTALVANGSLKISHLYPFVYGVQVDDFNITYKGEDTTEAPARMMRKAEGDEDPDTTVEGENKSIFDNVTDTSNKNEGVEVEKSDSDVYTFGGEVVTSVDELSIPAYGYVVSGVGYIEVHGEGAEIYGADGIKIATGEGRYEVGAGVYVVRFNGRVEKVIVR